MQEANLSFDFYDRTSDIARKISSYDYFFKAVVTISMIFKPVMGTKLEVSKNNWKIFYDFVDQDNYDSTIKNLKRIYQEKYN